MGGSIGRLSTMTGDNSSREAGLRRFLAESDKPCPGCGRAGLTLSLTTGRHHIYAKSTPSARSTSISGPMWLRYRSNRRTDEV